MCVIPLGRLSWWSFSVTQDTFTNTLAPSVVRVLGLQCVLATDSTLDMSVLRAD